MRYLDQLCVQCFGLGFAAFAGAGVILAMVIR
jgi:hypothetical protein